MSADSPKNRGQSADLAEIRQAFSTKAWFRAVDDRVRQHPKFFQFLWDQRFWWIVAGEVTFILPVLTNDNTAWLSYSRSTNLYGFDLLVPMLTGSDDNNILRITSFSINPLALIIYGLAALHLYLFFVRTNVSARLTLWHGLIQTVAILLFPFLDIPILNIVLHGFNSYWHIQPPQVGFWILLFSGVALIGAAYGRILRGLPVPERPPPLG